MAEHDFLEETKIIQSDLKFDLNFEEETLMRLSIRLLIAAFCYCSGIVHLVRWWTQRSGRTLIILNYHQAAGGDLRRHLLYLRRFYRMLPLEDALQELYSVDTKKADSDDRRTPLVFTFDDGYRDNYTHAFALAQELQVPITIFPAAGYVESGVPFWWQEGERLAQNARVDMVTLEGKTYQLTKAQERLRLAAAIDERLRRASSVAEREAFLQTMYETLAVPCYTKREETDACPLTWEQIREMDASGWVSFGAHTMHHPLLAQLAEPAEVRYEIEACRDMLEQKLGHSVRTLAYPFGQPEEVGDEAPKAAREAGYKWVLTTVQGFNTPESDPHQLRRIYGDVSRHWLITAVGTAGIWNYGASLLRSLFR